MRGLRLLQFLLLLLIGFGAPTPGQAEKAGTSCKDGLDYCMSLNGGVFYSLSFAYCPVLSEWTCETCCPSSGDTCTHAGHELPGYDSEWGECD
jgi:hypothetical protein